MLLSSNRYRVVIHFSQAFRWSREAGRTNLGLIALVIMDSKIVAVGLLSQQDLDVLGTGYRRAIPVHGLEGFEDLLAQLDTVEATPGLDSTGRQ